VTTDSVTSLYPLYSDAAKNVGADQYFSEMMAGVFVAILLSQLSDAFHTARFFLFTRKYKTTHHAFSWQVNSGVAKSRGPLQSEGSHEFQAKKNKIFFPLQLKLLSLHMDIKH